MRIAVVGATGAVGQELLQLLASSSMPVDEVIALASERSAGKKLPYKGGELTVKALADGVFDGVDVALFSAGGDRSRQWAPQAAEAGTLVIDNSSAFRMDPDVPLVIPEVNADALDRVTDKRIIANPNCTTIVTLMGAAPIHRAVGIKAMIASSYQAVSGSGTGGIAELDAQVKALTAGESLPPVEVYPHQIAFNVLPHVDSFEPAGNGYSKEELKMLNESRKILGADDLKVTCTCVRVPVYRAHSVSVSMWLNEALTPEQAREVIAAAKGVQVIDEPAAGRYPLPVDASGQTDCFVGRIRPDGVFDPGLAMWCVGDQLLKGAALNAVQIAEAMHARQLIAR